MSNVQKGVACVASGLLIFSGMLAMEYGWRLGLMALCALFAGGLIFVGIGYFSTSYWGGLDD